MAGIIYNRARDAFAAEQERLPLWAPVLLGGGAALYFSLAAEPWAYAALPFIALALAGLLALRAPPARLLCLALLLAGLGFALAQMRAYRLDVPRLSGALNYVTVEGDIARLTPGQKGLRLLLENVTIEGLPADATPPRVSVTLRRAAPELETGRRVRLKAGLYPPPQPALPGGYDFGRYYYFERIGAAGYAMGEPEKLPSQSAGGFAEARRKLTEAIRSHFTGAAGPVAAAFVTGGAQSINEEVNEDMRIAGLYHLLAVSGMNLSIVAGIAFFSIRLLLASIAPLALRYPIKKWAAALALLVSYAYLQIAGAPVSAERAFIMVGFIFGAIILGRDPCPMRSLAAAAFFILCFTPEAALSASFQLSFSATAALVALYEAAAKKLRGGAGFGIARAGWYMAALFATSLVAWLGTEPFVIYHFQQLSVYSLPANMLADPLVTFMLMPLAVAGVLLLPLGLGWVAFTPMQYGVDALLALAEYVSRLPYAMLLLPPPTDAGMALAAFGLCWVYFWRTQLRWLGIVPLACGMATASFYLPPDIFISDSGAQVALRLDDTTLVMLRGKADSFTGEQWARASLLPHATDARKAGLSCDTKICEATAQGQRVLLVRKEEALAPECREAGLVITPDFTPEAGACGGALMIDGRTLQSAGAMTLTWKEGKWQTARAADKQGRRLWVPERPY